MSGSSGGGCGTQIGCFLVIILFGPMVIGSCVGGDTGGFVGGIIGPLLLVGFIGLVFMVISSFFSG